MKVKARPVTLEKGTQAPAYNQYSVNQDTNRSQVFEKKAYTHKLKVLKISYFDIIMGVLKQGVKGLLSSMEVAIVAKVGGRGPLQNTTTRP